ncbi:putative tetratricopeptide repeat protein 33-like [Diplonema papillatum]|nr:putative tetratricopeptide repeat protein 33-like [Diplonema papillatum]
MKRGVEVSAEVSYVKRTKFDFPEEASGNSFHQFFTDDDSDDPEEYARRKPLLGLEDAEQRAQRKRREGLTLVETGKLLDGLKCWEESIKYLSRDAALHDMMSQVYLELNMCWEAVQAAEQACSLSLREDPGMLLTLGRAQLNFGEIGMSMGTFRAGLELAILTRESALIDNFRDDLALADNIFHRLQTTSSSNLDLRRSRIVTLPT